MIHPLCCIGKQTIIIHLIKINEGKGKNGICSNRHLCAFPISRVIGNKEVLYSHHERMLTGRIQGEVAAQCPWGLRLRASGGFLICHKL
jgi:hypothetical protein